MCIPVDQVEVRWQSGRCLQVRVVQDGLFVGDSTKKTVAEDCLYMTKRGQVR